MRRLGVGGRGRRTRACETAYGDNRVSLLVTGSIGIDTVVSPHGRADGVLGGSAVYFAFAASHYTRVRLVGAVGEDFPSEFRDVLASRDIDLAGLEVRPSSKTFRWSGRYDGDMNDAKTVSVDLNVLAEDAPVVPPVFTDTETVFLANTHPTLQRELLSQLDAPGIVVCDTMNLWIEQERESLVQTLRCVTGVIINNAEARQLTGVVNLVEAGEAVLRLGPSFVVIKKGEHGALLVSVDGTAAIPAFPTKLVRDPTGAGDSFAGGFMGSLARDGEVETETLRRAMVYGSVMASFCVERFSLDRFRELEAPEIEARFADFRALTHF